MKLVAVGGEEKKVKHGDREVGLLKRRGEVEQWDTELEDGGKKMAKKCGGVGTKQGSNRRRVGGEKEREGGRRHCGRTRRIKTMK